MDAFTRYSFDSDGGLGQALEKHLKAVMAYNAALEAVNSWKGQEPITKTEVRPGIFEGGKRTDKSISELSALGRDLQKATAKLVEASREVAYAWDVLKGAIPF